MSKSGHRQIDHTADLALELWATSEEQLLVEGARAVSAILTEDAEISRGEERPLTVDAMDREDRLVQWLNELLHLAVGRGFIVADAEVTLTGIGGLRARVFGESNAHDKIKTELKSATYHELTVQEKDGLFTACVVIDV